MTLFNAGHGGNFPPKYDALGGSEEELKRITGPERDDSQTNIVFQEDMTVVIYHI